MATTAHPTADPQLASQARDAEQAMLDRCCMAARGELRCACDEREAGVFALASRVLPASAGATRLREAALRAMEGRTLPDSADVLRRGWVQSLPRFRLMLQRALDA